MRSLRKFPTWLPRKLEGLVFSLFALVWTASLGGCNPVNDEIAVKYGGPDVHDTLQAKYGTQVPTDTMKAWYGVLVPTDTTKPRDSIIALYGVKQPDPIFARYGTLIPLDTVIAKYGAPSAPDTTKTSYAPAPPASRAETGAGEA